MLVLFILCVILKAATLQPLPAAATGAAAAEQQPLRHHLLQQLDRPQQQSHRLVLEDDKSKRSTPQEQPAKAPAVEGFRTPEDCPAWISNYAAFHKQNRGTPSAKYLVFKANGGGLGDRLRAMMFTTRLAVSLNRVVLFTWSNSPHEPDK